MKLSDHFSANQIICDGNFSQLDECATTRESSLVFCQTLEYLNVALENPYNPLILTTQQLSQRVENRGCVVSEDPYVSFFSLYKSLAETPEAWLSVSPGIGSGCMIHPTSVVSPEARLGSDVVLGPHTYVGNRVCIGDRTFVDAGVIIGGEGHLPLRHQNHVARVPHFGGVEIGEDVVILGNSVIVRAVYQTPTRIGPQTHIGEITTIGHGVQIGSRCRVRGNCIVAGRATIEDDALISASSTICDGCRIGHGAQVMAGSVVVKDVEPGASVSGNFAYQHDRHIRNYLKERR